MKYLRNYFVIVGIISHIALIAVLIGLSMRYELTPRQFMVRALEKSNINIPFLKAMLEQDALFPAYIPVSTFNRDGPRILPQVNKILRGEITPNNLKINFVSVSNLQIDSKHYIL